MKKTILISVIGIMSYILAFSQDDPRKDLKPKEGKSLIYVIRPGDMNWVWKAYVYVDDVTEGDVEGKEFICFSVQPGNRLLSISGENKEHLLVSCMSDSVYYFEADCKMGMKTLKFKLKQLEKVEAEKLMEKCKFGKLNRKPD